MTNKTLEQAANYSRAHRKRRWRTRVVSFLAAIVVFCTTYALILPAITQERDVYCGFEEHTHSAECYKSPPTQLLCLPDGHIHTNECKDGNGFNTCGYADITAHSHTSDCYNGETLICRFPEIQLHTHNDSCYEDSSHEVLICTKSELILHSHNDECKDSEGACICGLYEVSEHIHSSKCSPNTDLIVICGKSEHSHTDKCFSDKSADKESSSDWTATLPKNLTGVWQDDIVKVAESQIGYLESSKNTIVGSDGYPQGYSRYGEYFNDPYGNWSAMFVEFCLDYAKIEEKCFPVIQDCSEWTKALMNLGFFSKEKSPSIGDIVFFRSADKINSSRAAIVAKIMYDNNREPTKIKVIEGDLNNRVQYAEYSLNDEIIYGFGELDEAYEVYSRASSEGLNFAHQDATDRLAAIYLDSSEYFGGNKKLYVEKTWADGITTIPDEITVMLFANDVYTGRSMILDASVEWKGMFTELPETDANGNTIEYTVKEESLYGFSPEYNKLSIDDPDSGDSGETVDALQQVTSLTEGEYYRIVSKSTGWAVGMSNSSTLKPLDASSVTDSQLWLAERTTRGIVLQNKAYPGQYLALSSSATVSTNKNATNTTISIYTVNSSDNTVKLKSSYGRYLTDSNTSNLSSASLSGGTSSSKASYYYLYKWSEVAATPKIDGYNILNSPWSETILIPVTTKWAATVPESMKKAVTYELYMVTAGSLEEPEFKSSITLNSTNSWKGSFSNLPRPPEGSYYVVVQRSDSYSPIYDGETTNITLDFTTYTAAKVVIGDDGNPSEVTATNSILILLPETGGIGNTIYLVAGATLILTALAMLLHRKRRTEGK